MMKCEFNLAGKKHTITVERTEDRYCAHVDDRSYDLRSHRIDQEFIVLEIGTDRYTVFIGENNGTYSVMVRGEEYTIEKASPETTKVDAFVEHIGEGNVVAAPMPGKIIKILCAQGDTVEVGQTLAIIEAMKMENNIAAHRDAIIKSIRVKTGDQVNLSDPIIEFEDETGEQP